MRMLFYTSEFAEVEQARKEFVRAGIPCEILKAQAPKGGCEDSTYAELWIQNERDCHKAFVLCAANGIGFSKKARQVQLIEEDEL